MMCNFAQVDQPLKKRDAERHEWELGRNRVSGVVNKYISR